MGFFDNLLKKKEEKPVVQTPKEPVQMIKEDKKPLDLTKKISLNFEKLNLHKEEVRQKRLFLLDVSGSMDDKVGEKRKIDHLRDVMKQYLDAKILSFSSNVKEVTDPHSIPNPNGGTDLAKALRYINTHIKEKPERLVLVSDGQPDSESDALDQAKILSLPMDIIFIGENDSKGYNFMHKLASATGGQEFQVS